MFRKKKIPTKKGFKIMLFDRVDGGSGIAYHRIFRAWRDCGSIYGLTEVEMLDGAKIPCEDGPYNVNNWRILIDYADNNPSACMWIPEDYEPPN